MASMIATVLAAFALVIPHSRPTAVALASVYDDPGATASGHHYWHGFAALNFGSRWGLRVWFCAARCTSGYLDDHGPYVSGRTFDLSRPLKDALGCDDLCTVHWRVAR